MEDLPPELIAHIMRFLIPEVNPFMKFRNPPRGGSCTISPTTTSCSSSSSSSSTSSRPYRLYPSAPASTAALLVLPSLPSLWSLGLPGSFSPFVSSSSSSSSSASSPRHQLPPFLRQLPPHYKSRSSSLPWGGSLSGASAEAQGPGQRAKGGGTGAAGKGKAGASVCGWWEELKALRLVCKSWNVIATDPRIIIRIRRHQEVFFARIAEQAKRYPEMVSAIKNVAMMGVELTVEERNLLSRAYKNNIAKTKESLRLVIAFEQKEKKNIQNDDNINHILKYRLALESEICSVCRDLLALLDVHVLPHTTSAESRVFYLKMKGDYFRYLAEFGVDAERKAAVDNAVKYFSQASDIAILELPPAHPIRLSLALNFSVFHYEILKQPERACTLAKEAFDDAIAEIDTLDEESYKNSTRIMQVLRDSLTFRSPGANGSVKKRRGKERGSEV